MVVDLSEAIIANLEAEVYKLRCEIRELKQTKEIVTATDSVPLSKYKDLEKLYNDLWEETQAF
jgi:hypothetical protein